MLATLPERSVDLVFADPPYNLQLRQELWRPNMTKVAAVGDDWDRFENLAAYDRFTRAWLEGCRRVLKETGTIWTIGSYHNIYRVGSILMDLGYWLLNDISWIKTNPMPNFRGVRFTNAHETLIWAQKRRGARYTFNYAAMKVLNNGLQMRSNWTIPICTGKERLKINGRKAHATQKPEALLYRVILASSRPGDVVLDPFLGTGTTAVVAKKLHRHWLGIEQEEHFVRLARERIAAAQPELLSDQLFAPPRKPRIPFATLIEQGLIQPGARLAFGKQGDPIATIQPDGRLTCGDLIGSIHQLARALRGAPCNGWEHWHYVDADTGQRLPIDRLREIVRTGTAAPADRAAT